MERGTGAADPKTTQGAHQAPGEDHCDNGYIEMICWLLVKRIVRNNEEYCNDFMVIGYVLDDIRSTPNAWWRGL